MDRTLRGLLWSFLERSGQQVIQFVVGVVLARLLMPALRDLDREHFVAVLLTTKNQVIDVVTVRCGSSEVEVTYTF